MDAELWSSLLTITGVWILGVLSPGPNFLAAAQTSLCHSRRQGIWVALGIALGTVVWCVASLAGLSVLFQQAAWLYGLFKLAGAAYLIWLGIGAWRGKEGVSTLPTTAQVAHLSDLGALGRGLAVDLSNPKAAVFFTSLFAVMVPPLAPLWFKALLVVVVVSISASWYSLVCCLVGLPPLRRWLLGGRRVVDRVLGTLFIALGLRLATEE